MRLRLSDRFEPRLADCYVELFSRVIALVRPGVSAAQLAARYRRVAAPRALRSTPAGAFVLSRVTVGADVAITSVVLDALARRLRGADIVLVGEPRLAELFAADRRIRHHAFHYPRGGCVRKGIDASYRLRDIVSKPHWIVVDPDSRLTQLGMVPVCDEDSYYVFPSRSWRAEGEPSLGTLVREWVAACFGVHGANAYVAPACEVTGVREGAVAVSFGVGGNERKRLPIAFEIGVVRGLVERGAHVYIDAGASEAEREQAAFIASAVEAGSVRLHHGSIASFAALIRACSLYVGYDSSGQHIAAALGVPFVSVFSGYASPRVAIRWRPTGSGPGRVIDAAAGTTHSALRGVLNAVDDLAVLPRCGAATPA